MKSLYAIAWIKYAGAFLTHLGDIVDVVRRSFDDIHLPKKEEFYE